MKKQILTNVLLGASTMVGIMAVNTVAKLGIKYYQKRALEQAAEELETIDVEDLA